MKRMFYPEEMVAFARHIYESIADLPGHEPTIENLQEWLDSKKSGFEKAIGKASQESRTAEHNTIHEKLWDLRLHESRVFKSKPIDGQGPAIDWHVTRVENGWLYYEENPRITRPPMQFFVPLTTHTSPVI